MALFNFAAIIAALDDGFFAKLGDSVIADTSSTELKSCIIETDQIGAEIEQTKQHCSSLRMQTEDLQHDIESSLRGPADHAIQGMVLLSASVEDLYTATNGITQPQRQELNELVKTCKNQALAAHDRFLDLHDKSEKLMKRGSELTTELTAQLGASESKLARLNNLRQLSLSLQKGAEARQATARDKRSTAEQSVESARETRRVAEDRRDSAETARIFRDIFTLGLGEIGDWGGLNEEIDNAEEVIEAAQRNLRLANEEILAAENNLRQAQSEINRLNTLSNSLDSFNGQLKSTRTVANTLKDKNIELTNKSLDISLYLGGLAARTETISTKATAAQFARSILSVEQLLMTPTRIKGLIRDHPERLENTMELIARSDELPDILEELM